MICEQSKLEKACVPALIQASQLRVISSWMQVCVRPCTTACGHSFCRRCLSSSLKHSSCCPKCREQLPKGALQAGEHTAALCAPSCTHTLHPENFFWAQQ